MTKEKLIEELQTEFANEFAGIGFNFSQYIQDNVEEGLSGRQRRQLGQDHRPRSRRCWKRFAGQVHARDGQGQGRHRPRHLPGARASPTSTSRSIARKPRATASMSATSTPSFRRRWAAPWRRRSWRPTGNSASRCGLRREYRDQLDDGRQRSRSASRRRRRQRLHSAERACRRSPSTPARPTSSASATSASFRSSSACAAATSAARSRKRSSGSAKNVKLPNGYRIEWAGEFEELQQAKKRLALIVPITLGADPGAALRAVQFVARQPDGACRNSVCGRAAASSALYVAGLDFSISAAIGFVSLFGVSVMSGILIINATISVRGQRHARRSRRCSMPSKSRCGRC